MYVREYIKKHLLLLLAMLINFLIVLVFIVWFIDDIVEFNDTYIPWLLIIFGGIFITNLTLILIISLRKVYTKNVYVATMAICIFHCVILVGLPTGILFLCDAVKRHHHLVVKQGIVMVISMVIVLPFIAATAYVWAMPTPWQPDYFNDETGGKNIDPTEWMKYLNDAESINQVSIPKTHDSLTRYMDEVPWIQYGFRTGNINNGWSQTQGYTLLEQLEGGG